MDAENGHANGHPEPEPGSGADTFSEHPRVNQERGESGLSAIREERLINRALRGGWLKGKRWNTDATAEDLAKRMQETNGQLSLKERALLAVSNALVSNDPRVVGIATRNAIAMESQNQADELKQLPDLHLNIHKMAEEEKKDRLASILDRAKGRMPAGGTVGAGGTDVAGANVVAQNGHSGNGHAANGNGNTNGSE